MITILYVPKSAPNSGLPGGFSVQTPDDYLAAYQEILRHLSSGEDLTVVVRDARVAAWLSVLSERYGKSKVKYWEFSLRQALSEKIGIAIPEEISDADLQASKLADLAIPASGQSNFRDYILEIFVGAFITRADMLLRVGEIIASYQPSQWADALERPLVARFYRQRLAELRQQLSTGEHTAELQCLAWFEKSPAEYLRNLSALKILQDYPPELGERVLGRAFSALCRLGLDLRHVPVILDGNDALFNELEIYFASVQAQMNDDAFDEMLKHVSGLLDLELRKVHTFLKQPGMTITNGLVQRVKRKFSALKSQPAAAAILEEIESLVAVPKPSQPGEGWGEEEWLAWARSEYLPYRFWLDNAGKQDEDVPEWVGLYGDWLYENYGQMLFHSSRMAWNAAYKLKDRIKNHVGPVLVVMVDNLTLKFFPVLQHQLHINGFYDQSVEYCFSMLPSSTEVSKKCIITGRSEPFEGTAYDGVIRGIWTAALNRLVTYLPNIISLRNTTRRTQPDEVYFLNYLPVDLCLHQPESHIGIPHSKTVHGYMAALAQDIRAFADRIGASRDLMVIILSDHGSTVIPEGTVNVIENSLYKKHAEDEHHRYIEISDSELEHLTEKIKYECYVLKKNTFHLRTNYLIARRLYRFSRTDDSIYVHGGLTPEETIVPVAVFVPQVQPPKRLNIQMVDPKKIMAGTSPLLRFEVTNLNGDAVEGLKLEVLDTMIDGNPGELDSIPGMSRGVFEMKVHCSSRADPSTTQMQVRLSYQYRDQEYEQEEMVLVAYARMVQVKTSF